MPVWTPRQLKYQLWLAAPRAARPKTLRKKSEIADKLVISLATLREWEALPGFWDAVFARARSIIGHELSDIMRAMVREARNGSVQAAKLCLQVLGVHADKVRHEVDIHQDQLVLVLHPDALPTPPTMLQLPQSDVANVVDAEPATIVFDS